MSSFLFQRLYVFGVYADFLEVKIQIELAVSQLAALVVENSVNLELKLALLGPVADDLALVKDSERLENGEQFGADGLLSPVGLLGYLLLKALLERGLTGLLAVKTLHESHQLVRSADLSVVLLQRHYLNRVHQSLDDARSQFG